MMKIETSKQELLIAVQRVQGATTERTLSSIGIKTLEQSIELSANDRALAIYCSLDCQVEQQGTVFVPAKLFSDVVRELPTGKVTILHHKAFLIISGGKDNPTFEMKIPVLDDLTWQDPPSYEEDSFKELDTNKISYMIEQVQFCVSIDSPRNYGTVGYFHKLDENKLRLVGTDGYRLSHCDVDMELAKNFLNDGVCLSKRALQELLRMCQEGFEKIGVAVDKDQGTMMVRLPNYKMFVRLSAVRFPNYQGVLPKGNLSSVELSRGHLQSVTKRVLLAADRTRALHLQFAENRLTLSAKTSGSSESKEHIDIENAMNDLQRNVTVNGRFLTDVFSTTNSNEIEMKFKESPNDPVVIRPKEEPVGCSSLHVLVPIKENDRHVN